MTEHFESLSDSAALAASSFLSAAGQLQRIGESWKVLTEAIDSGDATRIVEAANAAETLDLPNHLKTLGEAVLATSRILETAATAAEELQLEGVES
ncbi:hypothetical protein [Lacipirellula sp.]|uniref:hypothetical protein n=1 Tax=Lacipirellula sp. TaxID=2691419 RepID=UPI003D0C7F66